MRVKRRGLERKRIDRDCPQSLKNQVTGIIAGSIAGQGICAGETLTDLVQRHCPQVYDIVAAEGFTLVTEIKANTHEALCLGEVNFEIRKGPRH